MPSHLQKFPRPLKSRDLKSMPALPGESLSKFIPINLLFYSLHKFFTCVRDSKAQNAFLMARQCKTASQYPVRKQPVLL